MNAIFLSTSWGDFLLQVVKSPQNYVFWLIFFLILLFLLSRFRHRMEEQGVNKAIYISRGLVGTFFAFIITPIAIYILLNIVALVHGVNTIGITFLTRWLWLTITSYWWLLNCFFGSSSVPEIQELYSLDSLIRIAWVLVPLSVIWLRVSRSKIGKLFIIPLIIGTLVITRYKHAEPTFITQDKELMDRIPGLQWLAESSDSGEESDDRMLKPSQRKILAGVLSLIIIVGFVVGLYLEYRIIGLLISVIGLLGFLLMAPPEGKKKASTANKKYYNINVDSLIQEMDSIYLVDHQSIEVYHLSMKITSAYKAKIVEGDMIRFPDSLCNKYESYFYDWCKE